eukprot:GHVN01035533.1.p1 GENE.GHVN01035533.1~~GHVN01035533.1.p1  ORF type:complete len:2468 (+),score=417.48 GHVN01035533.1:775-7404(+)
MDHQRHQGVYDADLLLQYLKLPRRLPYVCPLWPSRDPVVWSHPVDLRADIRSDLQSWNYPPIGNDEELVRQSLLRHFGVGGDMSYVGTDRKEGGCWKDDMKEVKPYTTDDFVMKIFAEAQIVTGRDAGGKYTSWLTPSEYSQLKERVTVELDISNKEYYRVDEDVSLLVNTKNASPLIIKVFEINTAGFYANGSKRTSTAVKIGTDIDLDGLVAGVENTHTYDDPPLIWKRRKFDFPQLKNKRGVWVIEAIASGIASRAVIRKGEIYTLPRANTSGNAFVLYDENNHPLKDGYLTIGNKRYDPELITQPTRTSHAADSTPQTDDDMQRVKTDDSGASSETNGSSSISSVVVVEPPLPVIVIPFSPEGTSRQHAVLHNGNGFAIAEMIEIRGESYRLSCPVHVDREELLPGHNARVWLRPSLTQNDVTVPIALLKRVTVTLIATDLNDIITTVKTQLKTKISGLIEESDERGMNRAWVEEGDGANGRVATNQPLPWSRPSETLGDKFETSVPFTVPNNLAKLEITVEGHVDVLSKNEEVLVSDSCTFNVNQSEVSNRICSFFLTRTRMPSRRGGKTTDRPHWVLLPLGKNGEPGPRLPASIDVKRPEFNFPLRFTVRADDEFGEIDLGPLVGVESISARQTDWGVQNFDLRQWSSGYVDAPGLIHAQASDAVVARIPWLGLRPLDEDTVVSSGPVVGAQPLFTDAGSCTKGYQGQTLPALLSLLEQRCGAFVRDCSAHLDVKAPSEGEEVSSSLITIRGLGAGDYVLFIPSEQRKVELRVSDGPRVGSFVVGSKRVLQLPAGPAVNILNVKHTPASSTQPQSNLMISLGNATADTRVHIVATRYHPPLPLAASLGKTPHYMMQSGSIPLTRSQYVSGRDIGDEYRYILDRASLPKFPGAGSLPRPGLLLNPWALRQTAQGSQVAAEGAQFAKKEQTDRAAACYGDTSMTGGGQGGGNQDDRCFDFLKEASWSLMNIVPNEANEVKINLTDPTSPLTVGCHNIQVLAVNRYGSCMKTITLPVLTSETDKSKEVEVMLRRPVVSTLMADRRLVQGLDPHTHHCQQSQGVVMFPGKRYTVNASVGTKFEVYEDLQSVWSLLCALVKDRSSLDIFDFVLSWPTLPMPSKCKMYSLHACHELSFFLSRKDPEFFKKVISPFLMNKKEKTFMDEYLLEFDLTQYLSPSKYNKLNIVERILLAHRCRQEGDHILRHVKEQLGVRPADRERDRRLLEAALGGMALQGACRVNPLLEHARKVLTETAAKEVCRMGDEVNSVSRAGADVRSLCGMRHAAPPPPVPMLASYGADQTSRAKLKQPLGCMVGFSDASCNSAAAAPRMAKQFKSMTSGAGGMSKGMKEEEKCAMDDLNKNFDEIEDESGDLLDGAFGDDAFVNLSYFAERQGRDKQAYRQSDPTSEWAENNYYKVPAASQNDTLIVANRFWVDFATYVVTGKNPSLKAKSDTGDRKDGGGWDGECGFASTNVIEAHQNFTEVMLALSVLDLPFPSQLKPADAEAIDSQLLISPFTPALLFKQTVIPAHSPITQQLTQTGQGSVPSQLLVSQRFYKLSDRYTFVNNERVDKFVTDEFLPQVVYGCVLVLSNPTSNVEKVDLLFQIPRGAIPVLSPRYTSSFPLRIEAFQTQVKEIHFYFPTTGQFPHYPLHVTCDKATPTDGDTTNASVSEVVAFASPIVFNVVKELTKPDNTSWDWVSQNGSEDDVIEFLNNNNIHNHRMINLPRIAWRLKESKEFYHRVMEVLKRRHVYCSRLFGYALMHKDKWGVEEYLRYQNQFLSTCGARLDTGGKGLLDIDPIEQRTFQFFEYSPLINARAHKLGPHRKVLNEVFRKTYKNFLCILAFTTRLDYVDRLTAAYYLFLHDRYGEGIAMLDSIKELSTGPHLGESSGTPSHLLLQYDYCRVWAAILRGNLSEVEQVAGRYLDYPVDKWRVKFVDCYEVVKQPSSKEKKTKTAEQAEVEATAVGDDEGRARARDVKMAALADQEPHLQLKVVHRSGASRSAEITQRNLGEVVLNFYKMNLEFLFSTNPFVGTDATRFTQVTPNHSVTVPTTNTLTDNEVDQVAVVPIPDQFQNQNVMVEAVGGGIRVSEALYANNLRVTLAESYGRLEVCSESDNKPLSTVYVKVYAQPNSAQMSKGVFYKDGYTDMLGKFDYATLNGTGTSPVPFARGLGKEMSIEGVHKLSILIISETHGAVVREVDPPRV